MNFLIIFQIFLRLKKISRRDKPRRDALLYQFLGSIVMTTTITIFIYAWEVTSLPQHGTIYDQFSPLIHYPPMNLHPNGFDTNLNYNHCWIEFLEHCSNFNAPKSNWEYNLDSCQIGMNIISLGDSECEGHASFVKVLAVCFFVVYGHSWRLEIRLEAPIVRQHF